MTPSVFKHPCQRRPPHHPSTYTSTPDSCPPIPRSLLPGVTDALCAVVTAVAICPDNCLRAWDLGSLPASRQVMAARSWRGGCRVDRYLQPSDPPPTIPVLLHLLSPRPVLNALNPCPQRLGTAIGIFDCRCYEVGLLFEPLSPPRPTPSSGFH
ncbi:hypothetical protein N658DRAFT_296945 [Parathielavia hyrcaniae]|uniref:Uncharacterized protein n=1 Tax=Parathielavia hyrcaniae TaxID=113614 RepID=A0AAN6SY70_9PEZI|nr:hypothetical protein N658DRAFT_296945 [Parathielavia hyrcaniae]